MSAGEKTDESGAIVDLEVMEIAYFHRNPGAQEYKSIERLFSAIRDMLPHKFTPRVVTERFPGVTAYNLAYTMIDSCFQQGHINHITGHIHFAALLLDPRRTLLTIHDCCFLHLFEGAKKLLYKFFWYDLPLTRCRFISAVSHFTAKELARHFPQARKKIRVIYDPVSPEFTYVPRQFNSELPRILQIGTRPNKNMERVAAALVGIPCHLEIVGRLSQEQGETLERLGISYSHSCGVPDEELVRKYRDCDMVVFASTYEGFGMPISEANATGRPVITSNICSMPEVAGDAACIVDPFDINSIRKGILKVIENAGYREQLIGAGLENARRFNVKSITQQYTELYEEIACTRA